MASEVRVNQIQNRSGLGTVTFSDSGVSIAGVTTVGILSATGNSVFSGSVTATSFSGSGANLTGVAATTNVVTNSLVVSGITTVAAGSAAAPSITPTGDSDTGIFFPSADTIAFGEGGAEALRIDSSGNVGIGTDIPGTLLHVLENNAGTTPTVRIQNINTTIATNAILLELSYSGDSDVSGAGTSAHYIRFRDSNTNPTGAISGATGATVFYNTTSDYRLKEDVTPFTNGIEKIMQLKPCEFTWKGAQMRSEGFIAHEVQEIIPGAVFGAKDAVNEDGNIEPQMIDPSKMVVHLTAALQEAVQRIQYLESVVGIGSS